MSVDKLVDSAQLDTDLTSVANAIRTKGGTSASLVFPAGFVSAIAAIPSGGGVQAATGQITIASDVASPTSSQSVLFPGLDLDFQPDFLWIGKTRASWLEHYNDSVHWIVAIRKTMFPPWRIGNGTESDDSTSEYLFLFNNQATYNPTFDEGGNLIPGTGYGINLASTLNQTPFTNNMWSVNADGTLSYSRGSNTATIVLKAGSVYRYFAIKV